MHANLQDALDALPQDTWLINIQLMSHDDLQDGWLSRRLRKRSDRAIRLSADAALSAHDAIMTALAIAHRGDLMPIGAQLISWPAAHDFDASDFAQSDWLASLD